MLKILLVIESQNWKKRMMKIDSFAMNARKK